MIIIIIIVVVVFFELLLIKTNKKYNDLQRLEDKADRTSVQ